MVSGKDGSRQVIEAMLTCLAQVSLPAPLALIVAVADHSSATALRTDNAVRPSELSNDFIALGFVERVRQLDQVRHGSRSLPEREQPTDQLLDQDEHTEVRLRASASRPCRELFITPEPDKSHLHRKKKSRLKPPEIKSPRQARQQPSVRSAGRRSCRNGKPDACGDRRRAPD